MADKRVVDAVSVTADHVICPCGALIELEPDPDPPPVLPVGDMVYLPRLMAIDCPKCGAEVRLDRFLTDLPPRANEDASRDLMTARLVNLTTEIGQLIVKNKPVLNAAFYLFLFTTLNWILTLVEIACPKCGAQVRFGAVLERSAAAGAMISVRPRGAIYAAPQRSSHVIQAHAKLATGVDLGRWIPH